MSLRQAFQNLTRAQKILILGVFLGFGYIGTTLFFDLHFADSRFNFIGKKNQQKLAIDRPITQQFIAAENGLSEVKFIIGDVNLWPQEEIRFELRDARCETIIASDSRTFLQPKPLTYTRFHFERIPNSQHRTYCAYLVYISPHNRKSSSAPNVTTGKFEGKSYTATGKIYENKTLYMRPSYREKSLHQNLWRLVERMSQYKPEYSKGLPLLFLMSLTFFGSMTLCIGIILAKEKSDS